MSPSKVHCAIIGYPLYYYAYDASHSIQCEQREGKRIRSKCFLSLFDVHFFFSSFQISPLCFQSIFYFIFLSNPLSYVIIMTVSTEIRTLIVKQHKKGKTPMEISDNLEVDLRTVQRIVKQYNETGDVTPKVSTGRHRLLSPRDERELLLTMRREPTTRPSTLRHTLSTKVSARTVRRTLARCGIHPYRQRRKLRLTPAQRHARLEWALEYAKNLPPFGTQSSSAMSHLSTSMRP